MKIGLNLWVWTSPFCTNRDLTLLGKVKSLGGSVIEFGLEDDATIDTKALRKELANHELCCSIIGMFSPERDLSSEDTNSRKRALEYAKRGLDFCAETGASIFSGSVAGVGGEKGLTASQWQVRIQIAAEGLNLLGQYAAKVGVRLGVEVLNRYENNLINTAKQARQLVELAQSPSIGIHLDSFHMNIEEENIADAIILAGDRLFHLHGSDSHRGIPGEGHVSWSQVASALHKIRYNSYVVIESFNPAGRLAPLARIWRPLADSQDTFACQGLAFLREKLLKGSLD
jgi:D-psicose/D-tagatose/L-ribulose 3-epimerase